MTSASGSSPSSCRLLISSRSRPEQNAVPAPRITTARTLVSLSSASKRRPSASMRAVLSAFRRSGRLSVMVAMESVTVYRISSAIRSPRVNGRGRALLGVGDGHAMRGDGHAEIARRVREAVLHEQIEGEIQPLALGADEVLGGDLTVLQGDVVRDRGGPDDLDRLRGEAGRAPLEDEARDSAAALGLVGARPHEAPRRVVGPRGEDLAPVQHPAAAALLGAGLDRAGGVGAAGGPGDGGEGL